MTMKLGGPKPVLEKVFILFTSQCRPVNTSKSLQHCCNKGVATGATFLNHNHSPNYWGLEVPLPHTNTCLNILPHFTQVMGPHCAAFSKEYPSAAAALHYRFALGLLGLAFSLPTGITAALLPCCIKSNGFTDNGLDCAFTSSFGPSELPPLSLHFLNACSGASGLGASGVEPRSSKGPSTIISSFPSASLCCIDGLCRLSGRVLSTVSGLQPTGEGCVVSGMGLSAGSLGGASVF
mmetsp:Transcript_39998/g.64949  ORF Transcript_39998/g.64949 Transcript_39998/m.64949 type:complete len:236 (+) Transcript_39998:351-1058(+)